MRTKLLLLSMAVALQLGSEDAHAQLKWDFSAAFSHTSIADFDLLGASFDAVALVEVYPRLYVGGRTGMTLMGSERFWKFKLGDLVVGEGLGVIPLLGMVEYKLFDSPISPYVGLGLGVYGAGFINQSTAYRAGVSPSLGINLGPVTIFARYERLLGEVLGVTVDYFSYGIGF